MTAEIPLTQGFVAVVDEEDLPLVAQYRWYPQRSYATVYVIGYERGAGGSSRTARMHRVILAAALGHPITEQVDHINGDGLDNRRANLRLATAAENSWNRPAPGNSNSQFKGLSWDRRARRWRARIQTPARCRQHLGLFHSEEEAARAYDAAARAVYGAFARLNFPAESAGVLPS